MPRKSRSFNKRMPEPDPKYGSVKYAKFINYLMQRGKKNVARSIFYNALDIVGEKMIKSETDKSAAQEEKLPVPAASEDVKKTAKNQPAEKKGKPTDARQIFDIALKNVCPIMELKSRRIGGANYQVPMEVLEPRKSTLGMRWMIDAARSKKGAPMSQRLASEIMDAYNKVGVAIKKREDVHKMAEANRAFAHFARFGNKRK